MKKIIGIIILSLFITFNLSAQQKYSVSAKMGTGVSVSTPSATPFTLEALGHYNLTQHWAFGAGMGYGLYDKVSLIPLYGNIKYTINPKSKYNMFADCSAGYGFALGSDNNGGFYLNPEFGVQHKLCGKTFSLAAGYGIQNLKRLKSNSNEYFTSQFVESVRFHSVSLKLGIMF